MRTTIRLDVKLLAEAKKVAIDTGRTFTQVEEDALRMPLGATGGVEGRELRHDFGFAGFRWLQVLEAAEVD